MTAKVETSSRVGCPIIRRADDRVAGAGTVDATVGCSSMACRATLQARTRTWHQGSFTLGFTRSFTDSFIDGFTALKAAGPRTLRLASQEFAVSCRSQSPQFLEPVVERCVQVVPELIRNLRDLLIGVREFCERWRQVADQSAAVGCNTTLLPHESAEFRRRCPSLQGKRFRPEVPRSRRVARD